jgi:hypothetical protein
MHSRNSLVRYYIDSVFRNFILFIHIQYTFQTIHISDVNPTLSLTNSVILRYTSEIYSCRFQEIQTYYK